MVFWEGGVDSLRYYVVADPHGFYTLLETALREKGFFDDESPHKLIVLGDLMDRGKEAVEMQDFILELMRKEEVILIRGNHEDLFRDFLLLDDCRYMEPHVSNGTYGTALQLSRFDMTQAMIMPDTFAKRLTRTPYFETIMPAMRNFFETSQYVFVHGWIPAFREGRHLYSSISDWRSASLEEWEKARWYNGMDAVRTSCEEKTVVCGHWHTSYGHYLFEERGSEFGVDADFTPYYAPGIIALDSCVAHSGFVNCIVLEDE